MPDATVKTSSSRSKSSSASRSGHIAAQTLLGLIFYTIWVLVGASIYNDSLMKALIGGLPLFVCYELGIASRYVPGMKGIAKRLTAATPR